jgi:hypothetical protein
MFKDKNLRPPPSSFICTTAVWGHEYTNYFTSVALPSLLADQNLPAIELESAYYIYTTKQDAEYIQQQSIYSLLTDVMPVYFHMVSLSNEHHHPYGNMSACHRRAIYRADQQNAAVLFFPPDCIFSNGSIKNTEKLIVDGFNVVLVPGMRLALEEVIHLFSENFRDKNGLAIDISSRDLVKIALNNLHPISLKQIWNTRTNDSEILPSNLFWKIGEEGLLGRCLCLHPLAVFPEHKHAAFSITIDHDYVMNACPNFDKHHIVADSDNITVFELTSLNRNYPGILNCSSEGIRRFYHDARLNESHLLNAATDIYLHTGNRTSEAWISAASEAEHLMSEAFEDAKA